MAVESLGAPSWTTTYSGMTTLLRTISPLSEMGLISDSAILETAGTELLLNGVRVTNLGSYTGISLIPAYAFKGYDFFTELSIPNSVTSIGEAAFAYCPQSQLHRGRNPQFS